MISLSCAKFTGLDKSSFHQIKIYKNMNKNKTKKEASESEGIKRERRARWEGDTIIHASLNALFDYAWHHIGRKGY